jgi:hypothetical protein
VPDPVAWQMIRRGWIVRDAEGEEVGRIGEVTGDENHDIFDGVTITRGIRARPRYVPSERVAAIRDGEVILDVPRSALDSLAEFTEPPPEKQVLPESSTWIRRIASRLRR